MEVLTPEDTARVLAEALPYIHRFRGKVVVVKYGGHSMGKEGQNDFAADVVLLRTVGILPVVVHGGGPQISELMERLGKVPELRDGLRVTDAETLDIARMVLVGKVNRDLVGAINVHAPWAVGLSGEDAGLITAEAADPDLGFVGKVGAMNVSILERLLAEELVPVIATIGSDAAGQAYNINADTVAAAVAVALGAVKLVYLTDVEGIRSVPDDESTLQRTLSSSELQELIDGGAVGTGMIPKASGCLSALAAGVAQAHVLDGRLPHALLLELFTPDGIGTMVTP
ncbi:MAG: acetylglutamate kinase [Actinobacteria bacterium]|nr:acetylglutamate kinase [Actinomycetota bacterium]